MGKNVWLVGAGCMALEYIKVLKKLDIEFLVIGRSETSARICDENSGVSTLTGGLEFFLAQKPKICNYAIVSVGADALADVTMKLLRYGVKNILVEKPAGLSFFEIEQVKHLTDIQQAHVFVGYNRRFYSSVLHAQKLIDEDGGVTSFNFEFTELSDRIAGLECENSIKRKWFLGNSTHVVDLAFYVGGKPREISCYSAGSMCWHPSASVFSGAGITEKGALFSYNANWDSAGRWSVELLTKRNRYIFRPLEKLQVQKRGEFSTDLIEIDDYLDVEFKPGLFRQVDHFISGNTNHLCTISEQFDKLPLYNKIANYCD
ncbi:MAG TPA: Gfo/Idh/MocA family oxidoreductase [Saprospiraceae bacterium]|nr:Gfo/Idh/MocA family oxidoreductase [Saprospiraceae bacterium]